MLAPIDQPVAKILAAAIFIAIYALIVSDRVPRTIAALLGAVIVMAVGLISQHDAFSQDVVDFNVIFLLAGMMIIASILGKTGIFQWLAVEAVRRARGRPYVLLVLVSVITAVASAALDNVTTVVLMTPVTFFIAQRLGASPVPFLISEIIASNIGGTATLIGDPPNIIVGSRLGKDFDDFLVNAAPPAIVSLVAYLAAARWLSREDLALARDLDADDIARLVADERRIEDPRLLRVGLGVLAATLAGFLFAQPLGLGGATIALAGAVALVLLAREDVHDVLRTVEWSTLLFFVGLFILVGAVVRAGLIRDLADQLLRVFGTNGAVAALAVLWMSAALSAVVDNIPYTITMIPLIEHLGTTFDREPLIWALVLGADLGGNATIVGASANVVVSSMSEGRGHPITFRAFLRYGVPATLLTLLIATVFLWLRFLR
jgi:Na+/H+ antiporter NhaD/arsenite permease-like protein